MSGGSFNYLCSKEPEDIIYAEEDVRDMVRALREVGANDAADETESVVMDIRATKQRISQRLWRLQSLWKAMEWWTDRDWGRDQFDRVLAEYRAQPPRADTGDTANRLIVRNAELTRALEAAREEIRDNSNINERRVKALQAIEQALKP